MAQVCGCGERIHSALEEWGCLHCGRVCCPTCGYTPEGLAYCPDCAQSLFSVYTRPPVISGRKRISAWWEAAQLQPVEIRTPAPESGRPR